MLEPPRSLLSRKDVAKLLGVSVRTVLRLEVRNLISPIRLSRGLIRYSFESIQRLIDQR